MAANLLKISEATSLAIHAMAKITAERGRIFSVKEIAADLGVSENHLSKVLQRLAKVGYVESVRGPKGGFMAAGDDKEITLLEIYEEIEGPVADGQCVFAKKKCDGAACAMGGFVGEINSRIRNFLEETKLSEMKSIGGEWREKRKKNYRD